MLKFAGVVGVVLMSCGVVYAATTIINTTPVLKTDDDDDGIVIFDDDSVIENSSTVTTQGRSADGLRIDGLNAQITNLLTGQVVTEGDNFAVGIRLGRAAATVENAGSITTSGTNGDGIVLLDGDGDVTNSGSILVQGVGADGFVVEGGNTTLLNSGSITSSAGVRTQDAMGNPIIDDGTAVFLLGNGNRLENQSGALLETTGAEANTVNAWLSGNSVVNDGTIRSTGVDSVGLSVSLNEGALTSVENSGLIINAGDFLGSNPFDGAAVTHIGSQLRLENLGTIEATGANSKAIISSTEFSSEPVFDVLLINSGLISTSGMGSPATILMEGRDQRLSNESTGVIQQLVVGQPALVSTTDDAQTVSNAGAIEGDVLLGPGDDVYTVVDLGTGTGVVDGEVGSDSLELNISVSASIVGDRYQGFEQLDKTGPDVLIVEGLLDLGSTGDAMISRGALCLAENSRLIADTLTVNSGAVLCGTGTLEADLDAQPGSVIGPGFSVGQLSLDGNFSATESEIVIEISGPNSGDEIQVAGDTLVQDSDLVFEFIDGYLPESGDQIQWLSSTGSISLAGSEAAVTGVAEGFEFEILIGDEGIQLSALNDAQPPIDPIIFVSGFELKP